MARKTDVRNVTLHQVTPEDPERFYLMDKDVILSKECIALPIELLGSPQYRMYSALIKDDRTGIENKKYLLFGMDRVFFAVNVNNEDRFAFDDITANPDVDAKGCMSLRLVLEKGKEMLLETNGTIFTYKAENGGAERKYFDTVSRDAQGNTEIAFGGSEYRISRQDRERSKSFMATIMSFLK